MGIDLEQVKKNAAKIFAEFEAERIKAEQKAIRDANKPKKRAAAGIGIFTKQQLRDVNRPFLKLRGKK